MDWNLVIEKNRQALLGVLAGLVAMAAVTGADMELTRPTLTRYLHLLVLRLLRPAEAAARRLIIVAARGMVVTLPPLRPRPQKPSPTVLRNGRGTGIVMPIHLLPKRAPPRRPSLPLFDTLPRMPRPRRTPQACVPRILFPGIARPFAIPARQAASPSDQVSAERLAMRLAALSRALDDLDGHAKRFARRQERCRQARLVPANGRRATPRRSWPFRPGRLPGFRKASDHEVFEVYRNVNSLAWLVMEGRDTS